MDNDGLYVSGGGGSVVGKWHLHRRLYDWVLHWADTPYGGWALFVLALAYQSEY